ncbi:MAG TPA: putative glycolipid-binding domain-containing protein [Rubrobacteraceae bacterium]|nr:putative glycolipid-binding domain-containing protein [Rubrobacteraceae bacterium]
MSARTLEAAWSQWDGPGLEHLRLRLGESGIEADGVVVGEEDGSCFRARYVIICDPRWRTRELIFDPLDGSDPLHLRSDGEGDWRDASGSALLELRGCIDVDLSVTPFTNTLPIRRLDLREGESSELAVVYVNVPLMELGASQQGYTCLERGPGSGLYRYEDRGIFRGFTADLPVDENGLVLDYPGIFRRVS